MSDAFGYEELVDVVVDALRAGDPAAARRAIVRARARADEGDDALRGALAAVELAASLGDDAEPAQALDELRARVTGADDPAVANAVGCALSDLGDALDDGRFLELAEAWLRGFVEAAPDDPILRANRAIVLERLERDEEAVAELERAVARDPAFDEAWLHLASARTRLGEHAAAADAYRAYLAAHPDDAHEWISLAIAECDAGRMAEAEQAYWRAAGLEPGNVSLHFNWLISALRADDRDRAGYALDKLRALAPGDWRTRAAEAVFAEPRDVEEAYRLARDAFLDESGDPDASEGGATYLAEQALRLALAARAAGHPVDPVDLVERVFDREVFSPDALAYLRELDGPEVDGLEDFRVEVDARFAGAEPPFACIVVERILATGEVDAAERARAFELRCGADDVRIREVTLIDTDTGGAAHPGIHWRSRRYGYPLDEFPAGP